MLAGCLLAADDGPLVSGQRQFEPGRTYHVRTAGPSGYVFDFDGQDDITLDGRGATFVLAPELRLLRARGCRRLTVRNLSLDYDPLPAVEGTVVGRGDDWLDVRLLEGYPRPPLEPAAGYRDQQAYFSMLWYPGPYGHPLGQHYWTAGLSEPAAGLVRVRADRKFGLDAAFKPGETAISLPVHGSAHRHGPGAAVTLSDNEGVTCEHVNVWSAPWFAFAISGNRGSVNFRHVQIRPRPGTTRRTSSWRDGFHVKSNPGDLLFEDCWVEGTNDDAFNIATHGSWVERVLAADRVELRQIFPLGIAALRPGDTLLLYDASARRVLGRRTLTAVDGEQRTQGPPGRPSSPLLTVTLDQPVEGLSRETLVWDETGANPQTVLRRCTVFNSCRFQSSVTLEECEFNGLCWCYPETIEGPIPRRVAATRCVFRRGRGNPRLALSVEATLAARAGHPQSATQPAIDAVRLDGCQVWGDAAFGQVAELTLTGCEFREAAARVTGRGLGRVALEGNTRLGQPLSRLD